MAIRCPHCGSPVKIRGSRWECGWCGDFGALSSLHPSERAKLNSTARVTVTVTVTEPEEEAPEEPRQFTLEELEAMVRRWNLTDNEDALRDLLLALEEKTGQLSPEKDGANFARNVDNLRLEYFRIAGKRNAMRRAGGHVPRGEETGRGREWLLPAVILAGAMLLSAILVAIAMAAVFL